MRNPKNYLSSEEETDEEEAFDVKPFYYYQQPITHLIHHYYISGPVGEPHQYVDLIHKLATSTPEEVIYLHLNTPGGNLGTGVQIINAMRASQAHIVAAVESEAHSLATLLFLAANEWIVHDNCLYMFHNFSSWTGGKGHEQKAALDATIKWYQDLAHALYRPFLTEAELERIMLGEDLYMHSAEVRTRLNKMVKQIQKERKEAEKKAAEKLEKSVTSAPRGRPRTKKMQVDKE